MANMNELGTKPSWSKSRSCPG